MRSDSKWLRETNGDQLEHVAGIEREQTNHQETVAKQLQTLFLRSRKVNKAKLAIPKRLRKAVSWR